MSLSVIRTDVRTNWPTNYHNSVLTEDKTDEYINKAQREICRRHNFTWMEQEVTRSTVDDTRSYSLPTAGDSDWTEINSGTVFKFKSEEISCQLINSVSYRNYLEKLFKSDIEQMTRFRDTDAKGTPSHYCIRSGYLELWKKPDHTYNDSSAWTINFEFYGYLADLSGDSATNEIVSQYPLALEYLATSFGFAFGLDPQMAAYWKGKFEEVYAEMVNEDEVRKAGAVHDRIRPGAGQSLSGNDDIFGESLRAFYE